MNRANRWGLPAVLIGEVESVLDDPLSTFSPIAGGAPDAVIGVFGGRRTRLFIKAVPHKSPAASDYRIESKVAAVLPPGVPTPELLLVVDDHGWVLLGFQVVDGRTPEEPWRETELEGALSALSALASSPTSRVQVEIPAVAQRMAGRASTWRSLLDHGHSGDLRVDQLSAWERRNLRRLAEVEADRSHTMAGDALLHFDLRHDNFLITQTGTTVILDWGRASRGQPWMDLVCLLLESELEDPLTPAEIFEQHTLGQTANQGGVDALLVTLGSYWTHAAARPAQPPNEVLRRRQDRSRRATMRWLEQRWG